YLTHLLTVYSSTILLPVFFFFIIRRPLISTLFPYTTLFRSPGSLMAVIVSSHITKRGPVISGDIVHIVLVQTNPGYGPNPGHPRSEERRVGKGCTCRSSSGPDNREIQSRRRHAQMTG